MSKTNRTFIGQQLLLIAILLSGICLKEWIERPVKAHWIFYENAPPERRP